MMKIAQFTTLPMAVVAIKVNDNKNTAKKGLKKALAAGMAALPAATANMCDDLNVVSTCSEACADGRDFMKSGECWGNENSGFCVKCLCNDGSDLTNLMPLQCSSTNCYYQDTDACPAVFKSGPNNATDFVTSYEAAATCEETNQSCQAGCAAQGLDVARTECYGSEDNRCVLCTCRDSVAGGDVVDISATMPSQCTNSQCFYGELGNCPTSKTADFALKEAASSAATCDDSRESCTALCGDHGFPRVHECWGAEENRCAKCICNDGTDKTLDLPVECTNSFCGYSDTDACPSAKADDFLKTIKAAATCDDSRETCTAVCADHGFPRAHECWGSEDSRCAKCICNDGTDKTLELPVECTNAFCGYSDTDACPTIAQKVLKAAEAAATCDDSRESCTALCGDHGFPRVHECWGAEENRCAKCICNDGTDKTLELPVECTNSFCGYSDTDACPAQ